MQVFSESGEPHVYYETAKKIYQYAIRQKDEKGIEWPIFGICQGYEILTWLTNDDRLDTVSEVIIYSESRPIQWTVDNPKHYRMYRGFPDSVLRKMAEEPLAYHAHNYVVATETYRQSEALSTFFDFLAVDSHEGTEFIIAIEAKNYPIFGLMNHPETQ